MTAYPYATHLYVKFGALEKIELDPLVAAVRDQWYNQTLARVNESVVRLGVMEGSYHWHQHDDDDEFFYVVEGRFLIDLEPSADGETPGVIVADIDVSQVREARGRVPSLEHDRSFQVAHASAMSAKAAS